MRGLFSGAFLSQKSTHQNPPWSSQQQSPKSLTWAHSTGSQQLVGQGSWHTQMGPAAQPSLGQPLRTARGQSVLRHMAVWVICWWLPQSHADQDPEASLGRRGRACDQLVIPAMSPSFAGPDLQQYSGQETTLPDLSKVKINPSDSLNRSMEMYKNIVLWELCLPHVCKHIYMGVYRCICFYF